MRRKSSNIAYYPTNVVGISSQKDEKLFHLKVNDFQMLSENQMKKND